MFSKIVLTFVALATMINAQGGGIVEEGTMTAFYPAGFVTCASGSQNTDLVIGVSGELLNTFECGHNVRVWNGNVQTPAKIEQLCLDCTGGDFVASPAVFAALGLSTAAPVPSMIWDP
ncbi:hypothetical protein SISNIDRAFT_489079 [Sistotremastrum niveocremeum HHB9708]|uniref:RlpA-like protein double-psi beta-barrel domain-containing protein n=2 Tax=Sistotremastraceae TaxID=3402574 RepID=A0A164QH54_9AGAM|nr:hypothetical protein SISNIDRAFT_489079 [Sistotremastrum niveocremeum HHB9708]KZT32450.1 hypothetical protein SISSUDRAFT_1066910 [Sistotremastrum suecicum HHB10207 ss-3]